MLLAACGGGSGPGPISPGVTGSTGAVKVALLLPLTGSGNTPSVAKALKQAAELALFDFDNPSVSLVPKDTKGTPTGAQAAAQSAIQDGAELIIGPLFAQEVAAAAPVARQSNIPMIAFSSDEKVAGGGVYLLSFLAGRDVPRIVSYAASRGKRNFALLIPQSPYGRLAEEAFAQQHRAERRAGRGARHLPAERRQRHARPGAAGGKRHEGRAGRCAVLARGAGGPPIARAAACLERRHQQGPAIPRHRAMGLSQ